MAYFQIISGIVIGVGILAFYGGKALSKNEADDQKDKKQDKQITQDSQKQQSQKTKQTKLDVLENQKIEKYIKALENSSIKDFQGMIKKIDDEEERKLVIKYIKGVYSKRDQSKNNMKDQTIEEQLADAADSFGKNICVLFIELSLVASVVIGISWFFGFIQFDTSETEVNVNVNFTKSNSI